MKIAFLTSGGIAPCLSASIARLTENYLNQCPDVEIIGYLNGYKGLLLGNTIPFPSSLKDNINAIYNFGGSPIGNSRVKLTNIEDCVNKGYISDGETPLEVAANQLVKDEVTILHTIGGDDTNTTAADLSNYLRENNYNFMELFGLMGGLFSLTAKIIKVIGRLLLSFFYYRKQKEKEELLIKYNLAT